MGTGPWWQDVLDGAFGGGWQHNVPKLFRSVRIDGVEATQAVQAWRSARHLSDPLDVVADNDVPLIAYKPLMVRAYLRSFGYTSPPGMRGRMRVRRQGSLFGLPALDVTLDQLNAPSVPARENPDYAAERGTLAATLNFLISAEHAAGALELELTIWEAGTPDVVVHSYTQALDVTLTQRLHVRGVFMDYNGPDQAGTGTLDLAAPTLADLAATSDATIASMPVAADAIFSSAGTLSWSTPLTGVATSPGGCSAEWYALNAALAEVKTEDGNRDDLVYMGFLPVGVPIANVGGCASHGVTSASNGEDITMAHEIGHGLGLGHAPCGDNGPDGDYPAYEPHDPSGSPGGRLGEYGLDPAAGDVKLPGERDYMGYCGGDWLSLYHYRKLIGVHALQPGSTNAAPELPHVPEWVDPWVWPWEELIDPLGPFVRRPFDPRRLRRAEPLVSVIGLLEDDHLSVLSVSRVRALPTLPGARRTGLVGHLIGSDRAPLASAPLMTLPAHGCGGGCGSGCGGPDGPRIVQALIPDRGEGTALSITRGAWADDRRGDVAEDRTSKTVWERSAPAARPVVGDLEVAVDGDRGEARWTSRAADGDVRFSLCVSYDQGRSWNALARKSGCGRGEDRITFDASALPGGEASFELRVHDGFHSVSTVSRPVRVPPRAPIVAITSPRQRAPLAPGAPLVLAAQIIDRGERGRRAAGRSAERVTWLLDGERVAQGRQAVAKQPHPGEHRLSVEVETAYGRAESAIRILVRGDDVRPA
ncbi:hypothetical protein [Sphingomonas corticis]|uniref:Penicillin-binding C-terminal domain-containing protein n=1 Tax=Sphingomonas corticis TaxID=2722791 RepID=A0ABX1CRB9_9SPHN|nr:hypothetical protein [Sphingomonas corticis]NJR80019.1 hypothetical protein [Sphingomonas corticis]